MSSSTVFFPYEIVYLILVHLPADVLYNSMRYVCKQWYAIIHDPRFIEQHLCNYRSGLLFHCSEDTTLTTFGEQEDANLSTVKSLPLGSTIYATCDGLAVMGVKRKLYIANLLTRQSVALPSLALRFRSDHHDLVTLVRTRSKNYPYKVFLSYHTPLYSTSYEAECVCLTLGKDSLWKPIKGFSEKIKSMGWRMRKMLSCGDIVYWKLDGYSPILSYDVNTEMFHELINPAWNYVRESQYFCVTRGELPIPYVIGARNWEPVFEVFFVPDMNGNSKKHFVVDLSGITKRAYPSAWVNNGEVLIFHGDSATCVGYNVKTGRSFEFRVPWSYWGDYFADFAYSLVQLFPSS